MVECFPSLSKALGQIFDSVKKKKKMKKKGKERREGRLLALGA